MEPTDVANVSATDVAETNLQVVMYEQSIIGNIIKHVFMATMCHMYRLACKSAGLYNGFFLHVSLCVLKATGTVWKSTPV